MNKKIGIICDSTAYLDDSYISDNNIKVVNLSVNVDEETYEDLVDINNTSLFKFLDEKKVVTTSQPSPGQFLDAMNELSEKYDKIICFTVSSGISGTYNSALLAKTMYEGNSTIEVIDTRTAGMGMRACIDKLLILKNVTFNSAIDKLKEFTVNSTTFLTIDDLGTLVKTGRMKARQALVGNTLGIKPLLTLNEVGKVEIFSKVRTSKKLMIKIASICQEKKVNSVYLSYVGNPENALQLKTVIQTRLQDIEVILCREIGPVMSVHLGKGGIGVFLPSNT